jgi:hypothetical protein
MVWERRLRPVELFVEAAEDEEERRRYSGGNRK